MDRAQDPCVKQLEEEIMDDLAKSGLEEQAREAFGAALEHYHTIRSKLHNLIDPVEVKSSWTTLKTMKGRRA